MADMRPTSNTSDLYDLHRFVQAQANAYDGPLGGQAGAETLSLDVVHLSAVRWSWVQPDIQALCDQERRGS
jgi:hypothetical protein